MSNAAVEVNSVARIFSGVPQSTSDRLVDLAETDLVPNDSIVVSEGQPLTHLYIVQQGVVELFASAGANRATISLLGPGDIFILAAVVKKAVALMSARSLGQVELLRIPAGRFRKLIKKDHQLLLNISASLGDDFRGMVRKLRDHKLRSADQRLAAYLVALNREQGGSGEISLPIRKSLIASLLGMRPASLSRSISRMQVLGVSVDNERVSVADQRALETFACLHDGLDAPDS